MFRPLGFGQCPFLGKHLLAQSGLVAQAWIGDAAHAMSPVGGVGELKPPLALRLLTSTPLLKEIPARLIGLGVRAEHVTPALRQAA